MHVLSLSGTSLTAARDILPGRLVHSLINFAFRSSKIGWEVSKTFAFKILQMEKSIGLMLGELAGHSSGEMK